MKTFIKKAETYARTLRNVSIEKKELIICSKFSHLIGIETCKHIAKNF